MATRQLLLLRQPKSSWVALSIADHGRLNVGKGPIADMYHRIFREGSDTVGSQAIAVPLPLRSVEQLQEKGRLPRTSKRFKRWPERLRPIALTLA